MNDFLYLGHNISDDLSDDKDVKRLIRNLYATGNMLIRRFNARDDNVKISLLKRSAIVCTDAHCGVITGQPLGGN